MEEKIYYYGCENCGDIIESNIQDLENKGDYLCINCDNSKIRKISEEEKFCSHCGLWYKGSCENCKKLIQEEEEKYNKQGYQETKCPYCKTSQYMLTSKKEGVCCECGSNFDNENYEPQEPTLKDLERIRNKLNRQIASLKKATLIKRPLMDMDSCDICGEIIGKPSNVKLGSKAKVICPNCDTRYEQ